MIRDGNRAIALRPPNTPAEFDALYLQRWQVLRQPLGLPIGSERDRFDDHPASYLLMAILANQVIGSARLRPLDAITGSIAYVAVLPEYQGQSIGTQLMTLLIDRAHHLSLKRIRLMARVPQVGFYERVGFVSQGERFDHLGIAHQWMVRSL